MPNEHESAAQAWLDDPTAQREIAIIKKRFPSWDEPDCYLFAIMVEMLSAMDFYGDADPPDIEPDDNEPWRPRLA